MVPCLMCERACVGMCVCVARVLQAAATLSDMSIASRSRQQRANTDVPTSGQVSL